MAVVKDLTRKVEVPHEPGEFFTFRKLSGRQIYMAKTIHSENTLKTVARIGPEAIRAFEKFGGGSGKERPLEQEVDRYAVLQAGILEWTYDDELNNENIDALDEETAEWAFHQIIDLSRPRTDEEKKDGS